MLLSDKRYVRGRAIYRHSVVYIHMRSMYIMIIHTFKMGFILKVKRRSVIGQKHLSIHNTCAITSIHRMFRYMNGLVKTMYMKLH